MMTQFLYKLFPYKSLFNPSSGDFITAWLVTIIVLYGSFSFLRIFLHLRKVQKSIIDQAKKISAFDEGVIEVFDQVKELFLGNALLKYHWDEYEATLIKRNEPCRVYKTEEAEAYFNEERILSSSRLNVRYWYAVPGILVGLGIFGTFVGLTFGLSTFKTGSSDIIQQSIRSLLSGMTTAFATSVWGIGLSILFNGFEKRQFNKVVLAIAKLNRHIDRLFTLTTQEKIAFEQQDQLEQQTQMLQAFSSDLAGQIKIALDSILTSRLESLQSVVEKLYKHGEQSTALVVKEIQTSGENIANNVRKAVGVVTLQKVEPALEHVANSVNRLVPAVELLRAEKTEASIEAIQKMVEEFRGSLSSATSIELERLSTLVTESGRALAEFPVQLNATMGLLQGQVQQTTSIVDESERRSRYDNGNDA